MALKKSTSFFCFLRHFKASAQACSASFKTNCAASFSSGLAVLKISSACFLTSRVFL
jgi:hypothetical protein